LPCCFVVVCFDVTHTHTRTGTLTHTRHTGDASQTKPLHTIRSGHAVCVFGRACLALLLVRLHSVLSSALESCCVLSCVCFAVHLCFCARVRALRALLIISSCVCVCVVCSSVTRASRTASCTCSSIILASLAVSPAQQATQVCFCAHLSVLMCSSVCSVSVFVLVCSVIWCFALCALLMYVHNRQPSPSAVQLPLRRGLLSFLPLALCFQFHFFRSLTAAHSCCWLLLVCCSSHPTRRGTGGEVDELHWCSAEVSPSCSSTITLISNRNRRGCAALH
jgi:hypothetical protein